MKKQPIDNRFVSEVAASAFTDHQQEIGVTMSIDRLLTRPSDAIEVCRRTNLKLQSSGKPRRTHEQILTALLNGRKAGLFK